MKDIVAIIDFGSQFTQLIAKVIRELGVFSEIISLDSLKDDNIYSALILSGGPKSIHDDDWYNEKYHKALEDNIFYLNREFGTPVLGICFGKQLICKYFGVNILRNHKPEFGNSVINIVAQSELMCQAKGGLVLNKGAQTTVWMSHSDSVSSLPTGFSKVACTDRCDFAVIEDSKRKIYGLQFHPEVAHTDDGKALLGNFLNIAKCKRTWSIGCFVQDMKTDIKNIVGDKKVLAAVSGGVDSTVAAALVHRVIGNRLSCVFVDNGLLRKNEALMVKKIFAEQFHIDVSFHDKSSVFLGRLRGVTDPEQKRKIIGKTFIDVFEEEARKIDGADFLLQGTLYPDVIESGFGLSDGIKSHHNVGGLPEKLNLKLLEPLRYLFKDEVRKLGLELGLFRNLVYRHPFPGPGLAIRIIGEITTEKIKILQEADDIYISTMHEYDLYNDIWQAFVVLLPVKTVGVMGDKRTYEYVCVLRAVTSKDGMTADVFPFEDQEKHVIFWKFLRQVSNRIVNEVKGINRVTYDITSKPPGTIEWE